MLVPNLFKKMKTTGGKRPAGESLPKIEILKPETDSSFSLSDEKSSSYSSSYKTVVSIGTKLIETLGANNSEKKS